MNMHTAPSPKAGFRGVFAALVTPMGGDEEVDYEELRRIATHLLQSGVHGLIPLGSTGEYYALDSSERKKVLQTTLSAAGGKAPVLAGTNAGSTREVIAYSRQAEELGCAGVMLAAPYYSLPRENELFEHFRAVDAAIGIPIMLYNYPGRTGVDMMPEFIERMAGLKNVRYVKESTGDMSRITELLRRCGDRLGVFCGCDTLALESLLVGAIGWVGGVVNVLPRSHVRLYDLAGENVNLRAAREFFFRMLPTLELMEGAGKYTQLVKAGCELMGFKVGAPRRPLQAVTSEERGRLRDVLKLLDEAKHLGK